MKSINILAVDDEKIFLEDIKRRINKFGYQNFTSFSDPNEVLPYLRKNEVDLILLDIELNAKMDGIELADEIGKEFDTPIIYLTAHGDESVLDRAKISEPFGYVLKPFDDRELIINIRIALYRYKLEKKLKERDIWITSIVNNIADGLLVTDLKGVITYMNPAAENITGWTCTESYYTPIQNIFPLIDENSRLTINHPVYQVIKKEVPIVSHNSKMITKDENEKYINYSISPLKNDDKDLTGVVIGFRDVTKQKETERHLHKIQHKLKT